MEDEKKRYSFTDKRGRSDDARQDASPDKDRQSGLKQDRQSFFAEETSGIDFSTLIMSFASAAMISLGHVPDPATGQIVRNPAIGLQNIGIISLLKEKTRGNLSREEETLLDNILYELRIAYIEAQKG